MKVLLATDGSEHSLEAAKQCCELLAPGSDTSIKILSVVEPFSPAGAEAFGVSTNLYAETEKALKKNAKECVNKTERLIREMTGDADVNIETEVLSSRYSKSAIVEEAKKCHADLIVVGSHGYGFWERTLLGSVSDAVIHHAPCSVLVVRKRDAA